MTNSRALEYGCIPPGQNPSSSTTVPETAAEKPLTSEWFWVTMARYRPAGRGVARQVLDKAAADPASGRPATPGMPMLERAFEAYMATNSHRAQSTNELDRYRFKRCLGDWQMRPLDAITRGDVEGPFQPHHRG